MQHVGEVLVHAVVARLPEQRGLDVCLELEPGLGHGVLVLRRPRPEAALARGWGPRQAAQAVRGRALEAVVAACTTRARNQVSQYYCLSLVESTNKHFHYKNLSKTLC